MRRRRFIAMCSAIAASPLVAGWLSLLRPETAVPVEMTVTVTLPPPPRVISTIVHWEEGYWNGERIPSGARKIVAPEGTWVAVRTFEGEGNPIVAWILSGSPDHAKFLSGDKVVWAENEAAMLRRQRSGATISFT